MPAQQAPDRGKPGGPGSGALRGSGRGASSATGKKRDGMRKAAYRCFAERGYHGTTVDAICSRAGVSKGAFYWHFDGKQAIFLDILETWANEVQSELSLQFEQALASPDTYDAVSAALEREACRGRRIMPVWLEFLAQGGRDPRVRNAVATFHRRIRRRVTALLEPHLLPILSADDIAALSGTVLAAFMGLVCQELGDPDEADFAGHTRRFMAMLRLFVQNAHPHSKPGEIPDQQETTKPHVLAHSHCEPR